jgi:hypothetical protein
MSPEHQLDHNHRKMLEIQIDNSLDYWKKEDILFVANFPYEYHGIKSVVIPDLFNSQYPTNPRAIINSKINIFIYIIENKILTDTAFYHDFDSFQLAPISENIEKDLGLTCYGIYPPWIFQSWGKSTGKLAKEMKLTEWGYPRRINFGNVFIKPSSLDILKALLKRMDSEGLYEEDAMSIMLDEGQFEDRVQIMNPTYNIGIRCSRANVTLAEKPVKIAHFPPHNPRWYGKMWHLLSDKLRGMIEERFNYKGILITGCRGFIGSNLLDYLYKGAYKPIGITEDIRDKEALRPYFKNIDIVIHTAAKLKEGTSDEEYYSVNVIGTKNVAELCMEYDCKMIHFSTVSNQGMYGKTKKEAQDIVEEYSKKGLKVIVLKLPQIYKGEPIKNAYPMEKLLDKIQYIIRFHDFSKYKIDEEFTHIFKS